MQEVVTNSVGKPIGVTVYRCATACFGRTIRAPFGVSTCALAQQWGRLGSPHTDTAELERQRPARVRYLTHCTALTCPLGGDAQVPPEGRLILGLDVLCPASVAHCARKRPATCLVRGFVVCSVRLAFCDLCFYSRLPAKLEIQQPAQYISEVMRAAWCVCALLHALIHRETRVRKIRVNLWIHDVSRCVLSVKTCNINVHTS